MLILSSDMPAADVTAAPVSPLNAVWCGQLPRSVTLPQLGHIFLLFPLEKTAVSCANTSLNANHYLFLTQPPGKRPFALTPLPTREANPGLLLLLLSPDFIADMGDFLNITADVRQLMHAVPLLRGDAISRLLQHLSPTNLPALDRRQAEEILMEVVGHVLHLLRLRHRALLNLAGHKPSTVADLLPRLLQARQFIEARCPQPVKTAEVADYVALSEYHFARLFKAAFDVTVHQFGLRLRLDAARHLLEQPGATVTETAVDVGYTSLSAFIHAFRHRFGVTPAAYRANCRQPQN